VARKTDKDDIGAKNNTSLYFKIHPQISIMMITPNSPKSIYESAIQVVPTPLESRSPLIAHVRKAVDLLNPKDVPILGKKRE
jgi:hypothetical protein